MHPYAGTCGGPRHQSHHNTRWSIRLGSIPNSPFSFERFLNTEVALAKDVYVRLYVDYIDEQTRTPKPITARRVQDRRRDQLEGLLMSDEPEVPWLVKQGELIEQITGLLPERIDGPWTSVEFTRRELSTYGQHNLIVHRPDGAVDRSQAAPRQISGLLIELRKLMYREGVGTWLSATWTVQNHDGSRSSETDFNYDDEPAWTRPVAPGHYARDLEDFPRTAEATPAWLQRKIREAEANA